MAQRCLIEIASGQIGNQTEWIKFYVSQVSCEGLLSMFLKIYMDLFVHTDMKPMLLIRNSQDSNKVNTR